MMVRYLTLCKNKEIVLIDAHARNVVLLKLMRDFAYMPTDIIYREDHSVKDIGSLRYLNMLLNTAH